MASRLNISNKLVKFHYSLDTFYNRLPKIVQQTKDYFEANNQFYVNRRCRKHLLKGLIIDRIENERNLILKSLKQLLITVKTNDVMVKFDDRLPDVMYWNNYLDEYEQDFKKPATYRDMNSIAVESYVYRKIHSILARSGEMNFFQFFDPFYEKKLKSVMNSSLATNLIFSNCRDLKSRISDNNFDLYEEFSTFLRYSLFGNRADLILRTGLKASDNFGLKADLDARSQNILTDQTRDIFNLFQELKHKDKVRIDVVLDNVGIELFSDLCFIEMLYRTKLINPETTTFRFFLKSFPWFISDVTSTDFIYHLEHLHLRLFADQPLKDMVLGWNELLGNKKWQLKCHPFFTTPYEYYKMKRVCPDLYNDFAESDLVIFKGDLNYVKLLGNLLWPPETPFEFALQEFKPTNLVTLRTAKYNLVVNLKDERVLNDLPDRWYASGDYAMISMFRKS